MAEPKTAKTGASVAEFLAGVADPKRRADAQAVVALMAEVTGAEPTMWGTSIVGFGSYHYRYDSGREGDMCIVGFSSRKGDISLYLTAGFEGRDALLARLGKHKVAKACLYVRRMSDVDPKVLKQLVAAAFEDRKRRHA